MQAVQKFKKKSALHLSGYFVIHNMELAKIYP